jgi:hypothetical protein
MRGLIDLHKVVYKGKGLQLRRRRQRAFTAEYHLKSPTNNKRSHVCFDAFIAVLGVGAKQVKNLNTYVWTNPHGPIVPDDGRGKHANRPNRLSESVVARIDAHILSFPRSASHYSLKTQKKFLSAELSVCKMYQMYLEKFEPQAAQVVVNDDAEEKEGSTDDEEKEDDNLPKPEVAYDFYNDRFRKFDLTFGKPVVDSCATCDELKLKIEAADDEDSAQVQRIRRRDHLKEADMGYAMRKHDFDLAKKSRLADPDWECPVAEHRSWDGTEFVCSDMAGVLQTPKVPTNKAFYLRKQKTYCYGLFSGQAEQNSLCFWNETIAKKGCNEVISAAHEFFTVRNTGSSMLSWWGDNTSSQMKNQFLALYANELVRDDGFAFYHRVDLKFSPPGHTFMENGICSAYFGCACTWFSLCLFRSISLSLFLSSSLSLFFSRSFSSSLSVSRG